MKQKTLITIPPMPIWMAQAYLEQCAKYNCVPSTSFARALRDKMPTKQCWAKQSNPSSGIRRVDCG